MIPSQAADVAGSGFYSLNTDALVAFRVMGAMEGGGWNRSGLSGRCDPVISPDTDALDRHLP